MIFPDAFDDRNYSPQFFFRADYELSIRSTLRLRGHGRRSVHAGSGTRGFPADIDDVGAFAQQLTCAFDGAGGIEKLSAIRKGVGSCVDHAHDQRSLAEFEGALAEVPVEDGSHAGMILNQAAKASPKRLRRTTSTFTGDGRLLSDGLR